MGRGWGVKGAGLRFGGLQGEGVGEALGEVEEVFTVREVFIPPLWEEETRVAETPLLLSWW